MTGDPPALPETRKGLEALVATLMRELAMADAEQTELDRRVAQFEERLRAATQALARLGRLAGLSTAEAAEVETLAACAADRRQIGLPL